MAVLVTDIDHKFLKEDGKGAASANGELTAAVWAGLNASGMPSDQRGLTNMSMYFEDFVPYRSGDFDVVIDTGATVTGTPEGRLKLLVDAAGNDEQSGLQSTAGIIQLTSGKKSAFEARVQIDQTANTNFFAGVVADGSGAYAADQLFDAAAVARGAAGTAQIGISILAAQAGEIDFVYDDGTTLVVHKEKIKTIAADTWFSVGFQFDGTDLMFYVDGVQAGAKIALATLSSVKMAPTFEVKMDGTAVAGNAYVDWFAIGQEA
jgi:hypothetical protein